MTNEHVSTETLADYAEGLLRESESAAVATHLAGCADCRAEELLLASLSEILAADNPGPMPAAYAARIDAALAEAARTGPVSGSFHPEVPHAAALDLTPSALAASSAQSGSAEVIDLAARRRVVAQGLSRVTTVAASIVLLIGGTVLGLQALNSGDNTSVTDSPVAAPNQTAAARSTIQPSPIRNPAVLIYEGAKRNSDGSWTNPDGVVVRPDGSAVFPSGKVLKKKPGSKPVDTLAVQGPYVPPAAEAEAGSSKAGDDRGPLTFGDKDREQPDPALTDPAQLDPTAGPGATAAADDAVADDSAGPSGAEDTATPASADAAAAKAPPESAAGSEPRVAEAPAQPTQERRRVYVEESGSEYNTDNFAEKVLILLDKAGYRESSTGDAVVEPFVDPVSPSPSGSQFQEASVATSAGSPTVADAPDLAERIDVAGDASPEVKRRVLRCARQLGSDPIAGDTGTWEGTAVTIVVVPDPTTEGQVIGWAIEGPCTADRPAKENVVHQQFVVTKP